MTQASHDLVRRFLAGMSEGRVPEALAAPDMTVWTSSGGTSTRERFIGGVAILQSLFAEPLAYTPEAIVAEGDRVAVQARAQGVFRDGEAFGQDYVFLFRLVDGRVAELREYNDTTKVAGQIAPRLQAMMAARR